MSSDAPKSPFEKTVATLLEQSQRLKVQADQLEQEATRLQKLIEKQSPLRSESDQVAIIVSCQPLENAG